MNELLIRVDERDQVTGFAEKHTCHRGEGLLHRAFSVFIFNTRGEMLIQKRSEKKMLWPLYWSNTCCSHPSKGESYAEGARRRLLEECGITADLKHLFTFRYQAGYKDIGSENEMCAVFIGIYNEKEVVVDPGEIAEVAWVPVRELIADMKQNPDKYTPWFKLEMKEIKASWMGEVPSG